MADTPVAAPTAVAADPWWKSRELWVAVFSLIVVVNGLLGSPLSDTVIGWIGSLFGIGVAGKAVTGSVKAWAASKNTPAVP
jgi:hypothetical protein